MSNETQSTQFRFIPVRQLELSLLNVRKTGAEEGIPELADLIAAEGILQNLSVYECPLPDEPPRYAVVAGGRRLRALQRLIAEKRIGAEYEVPCLIVSHERAVAISLAENSAREPMHPADEFEAFRALIDSGESIEDVAARFGVAPIVVQRRLKLANVSRTLIALYREGEITLEHLMAFAVTDDQVRQVEVWKSLNAYERTPSMLRQRLIESEVSLRAPLARFVGIKAYEKAGGIVRRDLFAEESEEGVRLDGDLVRKLTRAKLEKSAERLRKEGVPWVEVAPELDYASRAAYARVRVVLRDPTEEEHQALGAIASERAELDAERDKALDDEERETLEDRAAELDRQEHELNTSREVPDLLAAA